MSKEKLYIFDTTLRDGAQTEGVDFSVEDKNKIAKVLSEIGIDYIEGGWPGANPVDTEFFSKPLNLDKSIFTAFGMTKKLVEVRKMIHHYLHLSMHHVLQFV